jgi:hypothetical protein
MLLLFVPSSQPSLSNRVTFRAIENLAFVAVSPSIIIISEPPIIADDDYDDDLLSIEEERNGYEYAMNSTR